MKVVYIDNDLMYLKDLDLSSTNTTNEKSDSSYDGRNGVRAIRISPDGKNLASGDRAGKFLCTHAKEDQLLNLPAYSRKYKNS